MRTVIRQLSCEEEEKVLAECLSIITHKDRPICDIVGPADDLAHMILSTLSWAGFKIVEGTCDINEPIAECTCKGTLIPTHCAIHNP